MKTYEVQKPAALEINTWGEAFHNTMLNDTQRMNAFEDAIKEVVTPDSVVVDLGTGTGILAKWALEAGAARVYGIEVNDSILDIARSNLKEFGNRFIPMLGNSLDIKLPEKVDIIISETIGNFADNENCVVYLKDAKERFLKVGGVMIPSALIQKCVPVHVPQVQLEISKMEPLGYFETVIPVSDYVADPVVVNTFEFNQDESVEYQKELSFHIRGSASEITGLKGWFVAKLSDGVTLDTETVSEDSSWNHFYIPLSSENIQGQSDVKILIKKDSQDYTAVLK